jgi:hypothetical protein
MAEDKSLNYRPHTPTDGARSTALSHENKDRAPIGRSNSSSGRLPDHSVAKGGHEGVFVQPASYLRPRGLSHPMTPAQPERAIDQDEQLGLVSCVLVFYPSVTCCRLSLLSFAGRFASVTFVEGSFRQPFAGFSGGGCRNTMNNRRLTPIRPAHNFSMQVRGEWTDS